MIEGTAKIPRWVNPVSSVIIRLQKIGIAFFSFYVLSIPGRKTGLMRESVVSPFTVDGRRYVLSFGQLAWVRNARAAGWGTLRRGRSLARVALVEVKSPESRAVVREFPRQIPAGVQFFVRLGLVEKPAGPDEFETAVERLALFRIDPADAQGTAHS